MSNKAKSFKLLYQMKRITKAAVEKALNDGVITQEEYEWILN